MRRCLALAAEAAMAGEVPVGAVVVVGERAVGEARNRCEELRSPLAHAELLALQQALATVGEKRLPDAVFYCSLEPCLMCTGALLHVRVQRIVFAARDPKFGGCVSLAALPSDPRLNHRCPVDEGIGAAASAELLRTFFRARR